MYANFMHRKEIHYINIHIDIQCLTHVRILHFPNTTFLKYTKIQSSFMIFSAASFRSLLTASSTASSAILIVSSAAFMAGSASRSNGSGGGESLNLTCAPKLTGTVTTAEERVVGLTGGDLSPVKWPWRSGRSRRSHRWSARRWR
jgi:hypothetical protein